MSKIHVSVLIYVAVDWAFEGAPLPYLFLGIRPPYALPFIIQLGEEPAKE